MFTVPNIVSRGGKTSFKDFLQQMPPWPVSFLWGARGLISATGLTPKLQKQSLDQLFGPRQQKTRLVQQNVYIYIYIHYIMTCTKLRLKATKNDIKSED